MTIRHSLDILQMQGLIERSRGRAGGTFVRSIPPVVELNRIDGFLPQMRKMGMEVVSEVLKLDVVSANRIIANQLELNEGDSVFQVVRLRSVNATPILIEDSFFPTFLFPDLHQFDLTGSLYELLSERYGVRIYRKNEIISPTLPSSVEQQSLQLSSGVPVLRIRRTSESADGTKVEYSEDVLRCDRANVSVMTRYEGLASRQ